MQYRYVYVTPCTDEAQNVGRGFYSRRVKPTAPQPTIEYIGREGDDGRSGVPENEERIFGVL